jgi:calcium-dependent protein kinase
VIDFGLATKCDPGTSVLKTKAGTPYYVAPQVLAGSYNEKCDIWSCGVIMYVLLCGYPPFHGDTDPEILRKVRSGRFDFPAEDWDSISGDAKDLITKMLTMDQSARPAAAACLEHRWITSQSEDAARGRICPDISNRLRSFKSVGRLKKVALTLIAQQLRDEDIEELRSTFQALDKNNDGRLTFAEIHEGMAAHKVALPGDLDALLRNIDSDGSGQIDFSEFIAATLTQKQYLKREVMWAAFRTFDLDGDGSITKAELKQVIDSTMTDEDITAMISEVDLDGDGTIGFDEFCEMMKKGCLPSS